MVVDFLNRYKIIERCLYKFAMHILISYLITVSLNVENHVILNFILTYWYREVQQLRPAVRSRPEIHFALQVYSALNSNNYVRFFRLVKQSSFSNACIMHRYFTQVRNRALTSMMRTYGMGNKPAQVMLYMSLCMRKKQWLSNILSKQFEKDLNGTCL